MTLIYLQIRFIHQQTIMPTTPGKFIIIEGADATGKSTQVKLLSDYLRSMNFGIKILDFPRYYDNFWGKMVGAYLRGDYGKLYENNPYLSTLPYILDQTDARHTIRYALRKGQFVISNRYITSNVHQCAKLPYYDRDEYMQWLEKASYTKLKAIQPDLVIVLNVPTTISSRLNTKKTKRKYLNGDRDDIAEKDQIHQEESRLEYIRQASKRDSWVLLDSTKPDKTLKTPEEIHAAIISILSQRGIFDNCIPLDQLSFKAL